MRVLPLLKHKSTHLSYYCRHVSFGGLLKLGLCHKLPIVDSSRECLSERTMVKNTDEQKYLQKCLVVGGTSGILV
jgi:hypothetical protein